MADVKDTWDLTHMFESVKAWREGMEEARALADELAEMQGTITKDADTLYLALSRNDKLGEKLTALFVYAKMYFDQNMANGEAKDIYESADSIYTAIAEKLSFLEPELLELTPEIFAAYAQQNEALQLYGFMMEGLFEQKNHIFNQQIEEILSKMGALGNSFEKIYDDLTVNDIVYPTITTPEGEEIEVNNNNYQVALIHPDAAFRYEFFTKLLGVYGQHINTITSAYYGSVKNDVFVAKSRKYDSARAMALSGNHIPEEVYDNLVVTVRKQAGPLQEYVTLRKEVLGLEEIHFSDLFVPIVPGIDRTYTYEEAQNIVLEATAVLGEDYTAVLKEAFDNRWIDVYPAKNKATGAYAIHSYGYHPFSLLNFTGTLNDVFTIAHELGHVMHSYYSNKHQPYVYSDYCIFTAEVASTVNEQLLFDYLYKNSQSDAEKALLLCNQLDNIRSTLYRQTLFADFENMTHNMVEQGMPLLPDVLCEEYSNLYKIYHGEDFVIDDVLRYEWARIPHFYRAFYVYQYATGISAAVSISKKILNGEPDAVANYRHFLSCGGSDYPINLLKIAGVDMAAPQPVEDTLQYFQNVLDELKPLLKK
ncbi:MAG: oligoendopeptidase F [Peptococcaceae bacterium]|nr:oligoendopeptidase F [Peptococcaceae bacterium]